jgi:hypothetical protein
MNSRSKPLQINTSNLSLSPAYPSPSSPTSNAPKGSRPIQIKTSNLPQFISAYPSPVSPITLVPPNVVKSASNPKLLNISPKLTSKYLIGKELGFGGFGFVYACTRKTDGVQVACKFIYKKNIARSSWTQDKDLGVCPMEVAVLKNVII